ncbi:hypothetical protein TNCV_5095241 [Trichonephila clavipes]|nr:hypothetical protein TNCV_5095241 [Trichonephila clavipes]
MDFKTPYDSNVNASQSNRRTSENCRNILVSLMKEINVNSKLQNEILYFVDNSKTLPYIPKEQVKSEQENQEPLPNKTHLTLPSRPIQRLRSQIIESGLYERERYRPNPSKTRPPKEKERLQNMMAFGQDFDVETIEKPKKEIELPMEINPSDIFDEILNEIKERRDFLEEMTQLGLRKRYLPEIQCQISVRLKELEKLDKEKAQVAYLIYGL